MSVTGLVFGAGLVGQVCLVKLEIKDGTVAFSDVFMSRTEDKLLSWQPARCHAAQGFCAAEQPQAFLDPFLLFPHSPVLTFRRLLQIGEENASLQWWSEMSVKIICNSG